MSKEAQELKRGMIVIGALVGSWLVQPIAARLAGIPTGRANLAQAGQNVAAIWGVQGHFERFWIVDAILWVIIIGAIAAAIIVRRRNLGEKSDDFFVASSGGAPPGDRTIIGHLKDERRYLCVPKDTSLIGVGSAGSGKTGSLMIPNLLAWDGAAVSVTTKFDVQRATYRRRGKLGQVWLWAPLDEISNLPQGMRLLHYSPVNGAENWRVASRHGYALAFASSREEHKVWASSASHLIACALHACAIEGGSMTKVVDYIKQPGWRSIKSVLANNPKADPQALLQIESLDSRNDTFKADVGANIDQALSLVMSGNLIDEGGEAIDWGEFFKAKNTVYIVLPTDLPHIDPAPYVNVLLADQVYAMRQLEMEHGSRLPVPVKLFLDELGAVVSIDNLSQLIGTKRASGLSFLLACQDLNQVFNRYGAENAKSILGAVGAIAFGMGVSDPESLKMMETLGGGGVSLQQQMNRSSKAEDTQPSVVTDQDERWAAHQLAGVTKYNYYVHMKGLATPQYVRGFKAYADRDVAGDRADEPFQTLAETGELPGGGGDGRVRKVWAHLSSRQPVAASAEDLARTPHGGLSALALIVDRIYGVVNTAVTKIVDPGFDRTMKRAYAAVAADLTQMNAVVIESDVSGLNNIKANLPGPKRPISLDELSGKSTCGASSLVPAIKHCEWSGIVQSPLNRSSEKDDGAASEKQGRERNSQPDKDDRQDESTGEQLGLPLGEAGLIDGRATDLVTPDRSGDQEPIELITAEGGTLANHFPSQSTTTDHGPTAMPALAPSSPRHVPPANARPNGYPLKACLVCGQRVEPKEGLRWKPGAEWVGIHLFCAESSPAAA